MADNTEQAVLTDEEQDQLRMRLLRRIALAGVLIVVLVASLAIFDAMFVEAPAPETSEPAPVAVSPAPAPVETAEPSPEEKPVESKTEAAPEPAPPAPPAEASAPTPAPVPAAATDKSPPAAARNEPKKTETKAISRPETKPDPRALAAVPEGTAAPAVPLPPQPAVKPAPVQAAPAQPAPVRPLPAAQTRPLAPGQGYLVQMGVFSNIANAEDLKGRLDKAGIPAHIEARVQVGPFKSKAEAETAQKKLAEMGLSGLLLSPRK